MVVTNPIISQRGRRRNKSASIRARVREGIPVIHLPIYIDFPFHFFGNNLQVSCDINHKIHSLDKRSHILIIFLHCPE